jgi:hypothetical protein
MALKVANRNKPDYNFSYNAIRAIFSQRYLETAFRRAASRCPNLSKLDDQLYKRLAANEFQRLRAILKVFPVIIILFFIYALATARLGSSKYSFIFALVGSAAIVAAELIMLVPLRRRRYELFATRRLFQLIRALEGNAAFWSDTGFRKEIAIRIQRVAVAIEGIPFSFNGIASEVRRELFANGRSKGQAMRVLELSVLKPKATTFDDLAKRLTTDLITILRGQWYNLPDAEYRHKSSRGLLVLEIGGVALSIGGLVVVISFASKLGPIASILATALTALGLAFLNKSGLPIGILEQYAETASKLVPEDDKSLPPATMKK